MSNTSPDHLPTIEENLAEIFACVSDSLLDNSNRASSLDELFTAYQDALHLYLEKRISLDFEGYGVSIRDRLQNLYLMFQSHGKTLPENLEQDLITMLQEGQKKVEEKAAMQEGTYRLGRQHMLALHTLVRRFHIAAEQIAAVAPRMKTNTVYPHIFQLQGAENEKRIHADFPKEIFIRILGLIEQALPAMSPKEKNSAAEDLRKLESFIDGVYESLREIVQTAVPVWDKPKTESVDIPVNTQEDVATDTPDVPEEEDTAEAFDDPRSIPDNARIVLYKQHQEIIHRMIMLLWENDKEQFIKDVQDVDADTLMHYFPWTNYKLHKRQFPLGIVHRVLDAMTIWDIESLEMEERVEFEQLHMRLGSFMHVIGRSSIYPPKYPVAQD